MISCNKLSKLRWKFGKWNSHGETDAIQFIEVVSPSESATSRPLPPQPTWFSVNSINVREGAGLQVLQWLANAPLAWLQAIAHWRRALRWACSRDMRFLFDSWAPVCTLAWRVEGNPYWYLSRGQVDGRQSIYKNQLDWADQIPPANASSKQKTKIDKTHTNNSYAKQLNWSINWNAKFLTIKHNHRLCIVGWWSCFTVWNFEIFRRVMILDRLACRVIVAYTHNYLIIIQICHFKPWPRHNCSEGLVMYIIFDSKYMRGQISNFNLNYAKHKT